MVAKHDSENKYVGFSCYSKSVSERYVRNHNDSGKELAVGQSLCFFPRNLDDRLMCESPSYDLPVSSPVLLLFTPFPRLCVFLWVYPATNKA